MCEICTCKNCTLFKKFRQENLGPDCLKPMDECQQVQDRDGEFKQLSFFDSEGDLVFAEVYQ